MKNSRVPTVKTWFAAHYPAWLKYRIKGYQKRTQKKKEKKDRPVISAETTHKPKVTKNAKVISSKHLVIRPRGGLKQRWRLG
jgi:hypothetical protein